MSDTTITADTRLADVFATHRQPLLPCGSLDESGDTAEKAVLRAARPLLHHWPDDAQLTFLGKAWGGDWCDASGKDVNGAVDAYVHGHMSPRELLDEEDATVRDYAAWLDTFLHDEFQEEDDSD